MAERSKYAQRILSAVRRSPLSERADVIAFRKRLYGVADAEHVAWMYDRAPGSTDDTRPLWTWRSGDRVEATQGAIRTTLLIDGAPRALSWAIDLFVSAPFRARGVGAILPDLVSAEADVVAGTEVSEAAQKAFIRAGWTHLGDVPLWIRPLDLGAVLRSRGRDGAARWMGGVATGAMNLMRRGSSATCRHHRLVSGDGFDERADEIWAACAGEWPVIARRDHEWLRWRWDDDPDVDVEVVWLERRGDVVGWAVLANREHRGLRSGLILDLLCPRADLRALVALAVDRFASQHCEVAHLMFGGPSTAGALRSNGFMRRESQLAMMIDARKLTAAEQVLVTDRDQWYLTAGDSDLDRIRVPFVEDRADT